MGPLMYRQRPSYPALIAAGCVIILGTCVAGCLRKRIDDGEGNPSSLILDICLTVVLTGILLIIAFARYKFTHLRTDPRLSKKKWAKRKGH